MNIFDAQEIRIEQQAEKTLEALSNYRTEKYDRHIKHESLDELLYQMLENIWHEQKVYESQSNIVSLLSLLVKPEVADIMRQELTPMEVDDIAAMLLRWYSFIRSLSGEYYLLKLEAVEIEYCKDLEKLKRMEMKYKSKLVGCLAEQQELKAKSDGHLKIVDNEPA